MLGTDPLKIYYLVILGTDNPERVTAFQAFSTSWRHVHWALHLLATLPADVLEKSYKIEDVIAQRMSDFRPLFWLPVNIGALEQLKTEDIGPFIVCFSGEKNAARRVSAWVEAQPHPVLHVSTVNAPGVCHINEFNHGRLHSYCLEAFEARVASLTPDRQEAARTCLAKWTDPIAVPSGIKELLHNILLPNHMSLFKAHTLCETFKRTLVAVLHTDCRVAEFMNNHLGNISRIRNHWIDEDFYRSVFRYFWRPALT